MSGPDRDRRRPQGPGRSPRPRPQAPVRLTREGLGKLRRRADFVAANKGRRTPTPAFILLVRKRDDEDPTVRYGITVTKKVGGAVVRNRIKRRFRAMAAEVLPSLGVPGADHVLIGRPAGLDRPYTLLTADLGEALKKLKR